MLNCWVIEIWVHSYLIKVLMHLLHILILIISVRVIQINMLFNHITINIQNGIIFTWPILDKNKRSSQSSSLRVISKLKWLKVSIITWLHCIKSLLERINSIQPIMVIWLMCNSLHVKMHMILNSNHPQNQKNQKYQKSQLNHPYHKRIQYVRRAILQ